MKKMMNLKGVKVLNSSDQKLISGGGTPLGWFCTNDFQCSSGSCFKISGPFSGRCSIPY